MSNPVSGGVSAPSTKRRLVFPIVAAIIVAGSIVVALIVSAFFSWTDSICGNGDAFTSVGGQRHAVRQMYLVVWLLVACVPALMALIARAKQRTVWPWAALAGGFAVIALLLGTTARPTQWCLY